MSANNQTKIKGVDCLPQFEKGDDCLSQSDETETENAFGKLALADETLTHGLCLISWENFPTACRRKICPGKSWSSRGLSFRARFYGGYWAVDGRLLSMKMLTMQPIACFSLLWFNVTFQIVTNWLHFQRGRLYGSLDMCSLKY